MFRDPLILVMHKELLIQEQDYINQDLIDHQRLGDRIRLNIEKLTISNCYSVDLFLLSPLIYSNIKILCLKSCNITSCEGLVLPESLKSLDLSFNRIMPETLILPNSLEVLDISFNEISSYSNLILPPIKKLSLCGNPIMNFEGLLLTDNLQRLAITSTISDYSTLILPSKLSFLSISGAEEALKCSTLTLPEELSILYLVGNHINNISDLILPSKLKILDLSANKITHVEALRLPPNLTELELRRNEIVDMSSLILPRNLKKINIMENRSESIPELPPLLESIMIDRIPDSNPDKIKIRDTLRTYARQNNTLISFSQYDKDLHIPYRDYVIDSEILENRDIQFAIAKKRIKNTSKRIQMFISKNIIRKSNFLQ